MLPILYDKSETDFAHNGLGILSDTISASVTEERNGLFELKMVIDLDGRLSDQVDDGMIVKVKANDSQEPQLFRIYAHEKNQEDDALTIYARHITNDLAANLVEKLELDAVTADVAMDRLGESLAYPTPFILKSTNSVTSSSTKLYRMNPLAMIAGVDGSIVDHWGGEIERDNFKLTHKDQRGADNGVLITYAKNLKGVVAKFDVSKVYTRIYPFKKLDDGSVITVPNKYIDSPHIGDYPVIRILPIDYFRDTDVVDQTTLQDKAATYFTETGCDEPEVSIDVEFESLWETEEYKDYSVLEHVGMCDIVTVRHKKMGIDVKIKAVKIEYDPIGEINTKITLGTISSRLTDDLNQSSGVSKADSKVNYDPLYYPNLIYNSSFERFDKSLNPDYWDTDGVVSTAYSAFGDHALYLTAGQHAYQKALIGNELLDGAKYPGLATRFVFRILGIGRIKVTIFSDGQALPIETHSGIDQDTNEAGKIVAGYFEVSSLFWRPSIDYINLAPCELVMQLRFDVISGFIYLDGVSGIPRVSTQSLIAYLDGKKNHNDSAFIVQSGNPDAATGDIWFEEGS